MPVQNGERLATKQDLADMYQEILPYLGGSADAGFTPVGTVISVMGVTAPANYLACDGTIYNIADYPELANYFYQQFGSKNKFGGNGTTTFAVPDLRGEFLRGTGTNSHANQGNGAEVGVHQDATENLWITRYRDSINSDNNLLINSDIAKNDPSLNLQPRNSDSNIAGRLAYHNIKITSSTVDSSQSVSRYTERPTNTSILWCIATKNIYLDPKNDYSTEEKVIGTWIDGKTLYQKTYNVGTIMNGSSVNIDIENLGTIVNSFGYGRASTLTATTPNELGWAKFGGKTERLSGSATNSITVNNPTFASGKIWFYLTGTGSPNPVDGMAKVVLTIQYTKTT